MQKKASAAEAVLTLEAVSTVKGLVGPAVKPKKRAAAKETSSSAKRSGESEKTAPKAKRRTSSASKRPRRQGIRADALIRARDRQAQESSLQEGAQALEAFDDAYPLPIFEADADPEAPRTGPAKLPDLPLIEQLEAEALLNRPKQTKKKRPPTAGTALAQRLSGLVKSALTEASDHLLGRSSPEFMLVPLNPVRVIVALSGGRDSMALLDVVARIAADRRQQLIAELRAVYVHHGLEREADAWEEHCRRECEKRGVIFEAVRVRVQRSGDGIEAAARDVRYRALAQYALKSGCSIIMTAHHEDDRIETFLLQWMRGAGLEGLAAFPEVRELAAPSMEDAKAVQARKQVFLLRPWSGVLRRDIERYVKNRRIPYVDDPSNNSPKYDRNRVRSEIIPRLEAIRPGFSASAARSVGLIGEALEVLKSVARADLEACRSETMPHGLSVYRLLELIPARQAWCLRAWIAAEGLRPLSKARLDDLLRQVRETHSDATFSFHVQRKEIRRWGSDIIVRDAVTRRLGVERDAALSPSEGAHEIALPQWGGVIEMVPCMGDEDGIARSRVTAPEAKLEVRAAVGAVKLKLWALRPGKALKDLYAQAGIPAYVRVDMPKLWLNNELLFAAGLGMDVRFADDPAKYPDRVKFLWRPDRSLWDARPMPNYAELPEAERRLREARVREAAKSSLKLRESIARERSAEKNR